MDDIVFQGDPGKLKLLCLIDGKVATDEQLKRIFAALQSDRMRAALCASIEEVDHA